MNDSNSKTVRRQVLEEAADLIDGDRNKTYGSPTENFTNIAELWNVRFKHMFREGEKFTASDVADAMILLKAARGIAGSTRDTYVDIAGYAGCGQEAREAEAEKPKDPKEPWKNGDTREVKFPRQSFSWSDVTDKPSKKKEPSVVNDVKLMLRTVGVDPDMVAAEAIRQLVKWQGRQNGRK